MIRWAGCIVANNATGFDCGDREVSRGRCERACVKRKGDSRSGMGSFRGGFPGVAVSGFKSCFPSVPLIMACILFSESSFSVSIRSFEAGSFRCRAVPQVIRL